MDNGVPQSRTTLQDWEAWLAPQVRAVDLLGETPISAEKCQQPGKVIGLRLPRFPDLGSLLGCLVDDHI
jgi:hypothetical protein